MTQPRNFGFGEDETMLRDSARKFLADNAGVEALRRLVARDHREAYESAVPPAPWDEGLWRQMVELGWTGLGVPERAGGTGMKMVAVAALAEEAGRAALVSPLHHDPARHLCAARGDSACRDGGARAHRRRHADGAGDHQCRRLVGADDTDVSATASADGAVLDGHRGVRPGRAQGRRLRRRGARAPAASGCTSSTPTPPASSIRARSHRRPDPRPGARRVRATCACRPTASPPHRRCRRRGAAPRPARAAHHRRRRHVRRRRMAAADHDRLRAGAQAVRSPARLLPGGETPAGQHDARHRSGALAASTTPPAPSTASPARPSATRAWPRPAPPTWPPSAPAARSSSTAASASPGSATSTSGSNASSTTRCSSVMAHTTGATWPT